MAEGFGNGLQNEHGLLGDFGANAVAGEDGQVQEHLGISVTEIVAGACEVGISAPQPGFARPDSRGGCPHMHLTDSCSRGLHTPQIVFLFVVAFGLCGHWYAERVGLRGQWKRLRRLRNVRWRCCCCGRGRSGREGFDQRRR